MPKSNTTQGPANRLRQGYGGPPKLASALQALRRAEAEAGRHVLGGRSVLPHHPYDDALNLHLIRIDEDRLHGRVGRLKANLAARVAVELLERHIRAPLQGDDHLAVVGGLPILDDLEVAVADLLVDHGIAANA